MLLPHLDVGWDEPEGVVTVCELYEGFCALLVASFTVCLFFPRDGQAQREFYLQFGAPWFASSSRTSAWQGSSVGHQHMRSLPDNSWRISSRVVASCFSIAGSAAEGPVFPDVGRYLLPDLLLVGQLAAMFCASPRRPFSAWNREFSLLGSAAGRVRGFGESLVFAEMLDHVVLRCPDPDESVTIAECDGGFAFECGICWCVGCCFVHAVHNFSVLPRQCPTRYHIYRR